MNKSNENQEEYDDGYKWRWLQLCKLAICILLGHRAYLSDKKDKELLPAPDMVGMWCKDWLQPHWLFSIKKTHFPDVEFDLFPISDKGVTGAVVYSGRFFNKFAHPKSSSYKYCLDQDLLHSVGSISRYAADTYGENLVCIEAYQDKYLKEKIELNDSLLLYWCKNQELISDHPPVRMLYQALFSGEEMDETSKEEIITEGFNELIQSNRHVYLMSRQALFRGFQGGFDFIQYSGETLNEHLYNWLKEKTGILPYDLEYLSIQSINPKWLMGRNIYTKGGGAIVGGNRGPLFYNPIFYFDCGQEEYDDPPTRAFASPEENQPTSPVAWSISGPAQPVMEMPDAPQFTAPVGYVEPPSPTAVQIVRFCGQCGTAVTPEYKFCSKCGQEMAEEPAPPLQAPAEDWICSECKAVVPANAVRCPTCQAVFDEEEETGQADLPLLALAPDPAPAEEWVCSECQAVVPEDAVRCPSCGAFLEEDEETGQAALPLPVPVPEPLAPPPQAPLSVPVHPLSPTFCMMCGEKVPANGNYCPRCGIKLEL